MRVTSLTKRARQKTQGTWRSLWISFDENIPLLKKRAQELLSGHIPTRAFKALGHPLSRKRSQQFDRPTKKPQFAFAPTGGRRYSGIIGYGGVVPLLPVNTQKGRLIRSLRVFRRGPKIILTFVDPKAKYRLAQFGTESTIPSGFWEAMLEYQSQLISSLIARAKRRARQTS